MRSFGNDGAEDGEGEDADIWLNEPAEGDQS